MLNLTNSDGPKDIGVPSETEVAGCLSVLAWMKLKCGLRSTDTVKTVEMALETVQDHWRLERRNLRQD